MGFFSIGGEVTTIGYVSGMQLRHNNSRHREFVIRVKSLGKRLDKRDMEILDLIKVRAPDDIALWIQNCDALAGVCKALLDREG